MRDPHNLLKWRKSSASVQGNCVEVVLHHGKIYVRDSKEPAGICLCFTPTEWIAFVVGVVLGEFNIPALRGAD